MENYRTETDKDGSVHIIGDEGNQLSIPSWAPDRKVLAARVASMLSHYECRVALDKGETRSFSGSCNPPGVIGSDHAQQRPLLLRAAHDAEQEAQTWANYREHVAAAMSPPQIAEVPRVYAGTIEEFGYSKVPATVAGIPADLSAALRTIYGYATVNMEAYLAAAKTYRELREQRYADEDAAMHEQAAAQMADELS